MRDLPVHQNSRLPLVLTIGGPHPHELRRPLPLRRKPPPGRLLLPLALQRRLDLLARLTPQILDFLVDILTHAEVGLELRRRPAQKTDRRAVVRTCRRLFRIIVSHGHATLPQRGHLDLHAPFRLFPVIAHPAVPRLPILRLLRGLRPARRLAEMLHELGPLGGLGYLVMLLVLLLLIDLPVLMMLIGLLALLRPARRRVPMVVPHPGTDHVLVPFSRVRPTPRWRRLALIRHHRGPIHDLVALLLHPLHPIRRAEPLERGWRHVPNATDGNCDSDRPRRFTPLS
mmetsp:Transcript_7881/g.21447  ORF Transcript_7881/g.21447 Transcript_7881/m.21447 type:complete len:285 (+) Transcript_7881:402-1256(+)